ncbi:hypothetical protein PDJAM_G00213720 [Pangasius djambal]|uniref:Uncharacterized protein n=1 Tax=Pangasius djambal TaxID=1691987 RepID=A0ACC5YAB4_9TELE|nr:hypothetical protein [Pangasius djambal]
MRWQPCLIVFYLAYPTQGRGVACNLSQGTQGTRLETPWMGCQPIAGHAHTPIDTHKLGNAYQPEFPEETPEAGRSLHELVVDELNELTLWLRLFLWREAVTPSREGKSAELFKPRSGSEVWISAELSYAHGKTQF